MPYSTGFALRAARVSRSNATISFKSLGTDATEPLNFNKRHSPRRLFNVVSHFSTGLMCFGLIKQH
jgi:hypothetical protein